MYMQPQKIRDIKFLSDIIAQKYINQKTNININFVFLDYKLLKVKLCALHFSTLTNLKKKKKKDFSYILSTL